MENPSTFRDDTQKKVLHASEQERPDVAQARQEWKEAQGGFQSDRLVFIDESGVNTKMTRRFGRSLKGQRLVDKVPHGHYKTTTFIAALRSDCVCAPFLLDSPMDGDCFLVYVEQILCPALRPGDIVILDNLRLHKAPSIEKLIRAAGATIKFLPPYSPDLNPIEQLFAKFKQLLRSAGKRTLKELWDYISDIICEAFSATECSNYFRNSGYTVS